MKYICILLILLAACAAPDTSRDDLLALLDKEEPVKDVDIEELDEDALAEIEKIEEPGVETDMDEVTTQIIEETFEEEKQAANSCMEICEQSCVEDAQFTCLQEDSSCIQYCEMVLMDPSCTPLCTTPPDICMPEIEQICKAQCPDVCK